MIKKRHLLAVAVLTLLFSATAWADRVIVPVPVPVPSPVVVVPGPPPAPAPPPPPVVVVPAPAPPVIVLPFPPLPPGIVIVPGPPVYWFWDDGRGRWFYYDVKHRRHYSKRHVFRDNGRHYYMEGGKWAPARPDIAKKKGWHKRKHKK